MRLISFTCEKCGTLVKRAAQPTFDLANMPKHCVKCREKGTYQIRNIAVGELGFRTYADYLRSDLWQNVRRMILDRDGHKCVLCSAPANQVHHQSYAAEVLVGTESRLLQSLCRDCHHGIEFDHAGVKRDILGANSLLRRCLKRGQTPAFLNAKYAKKAAITH